MRNGQILHDNAPAQTAKYTQEFLLENEIQQLDHPPYSPDYHHVTFSISKIEKKTGHRFHSRSALGSAVYQCLRSMPFWSTETQSRI